MEQAEKQGEFEFRELITHRRPRKQAPRRSRPEMFRGRVISPIVAFAPDRPGNGRHGNRT